MSLPLSEVSPYILAKAPTAKGVATSTLLLVLLACVLELAWLLAFGCLVGLLLAAAPVSLDISLSKLLLVPGLVLPELLASGLFPLAAGAGDV